MRNLKRALSLTLASVMLLGMMVVGSSAAAGYDDVKETDNVEAIEVLQTVGVMVGDERGFGPDRPVNRAEMAVVMGLLLNLDYNYYSATCPFNDVYDWARGWVGACAANGIVSGRGDGVYDPGATVTAVEGASMLMRALGYFKYASDYADGFEVSTVRQGTTIGIFDGVGSSATEPMTRNQVAQMVLNTLKSGMVQPDGNTLNYFDNNGNIIATGGKINYVYVTSNKSFAQSISSVSATSMGSTNNSPIVELGEQLYNGELKLYDKRQDAFGRPARVWEYQGNEIGTYIKKELLKKEYSVKVTGEDLYNLLTRNTIEDYNFRIYVDGVVTTTIDRNYNATAVNKTVLGDAWFDTTDLYRTNKDGVGATGKGVLTQVFVDTDYVDKNDYTVYINIINTYLAKASEDYDTKNDDVTLNVHAITDDGHAKVYVKSNPDSDEALYERMVVEGDEFSIQDVKEDELFLVTVAEGRIQEMTKPEIVSDTVINAFSKRDWINLSGTQYDYASTARYDAEVLFNYDNPNLKDVTYNVILDKYGYAIGLEMNEDPDQYVFLTGIEDSFSNLTTRQVDANVIHVDGTLKTVKVDMKESKFINTYQAGDDYDYFHGEPSQANTWCTYRVDSNGVYTLEEVAYSIFKADGVTKRDAAQWATDVKAGDAAREIDQKHISLPSGETATSVAYGNDKTVYLNVELDQVPVNNWTSQQNRRIISDVNTVVTGHRNVKTTVSNVTDSDKDGFYWKDAADAAKNNYEAPANEIYTLYDDDNYIIAVVTIGEDDGISSNWVYVNSNKVKSEAYNGNTTKAANDGKWTWSREVIAEGKKTEIKYVGDHLKYIGTDEMVRGNWYEVKYDANGNVNKAVSLEEKIAANIADDGYVSDIKAVKDAVTKKDNVLLADRANISDLKFNEQGTLYVENDITKGFAVSPEVKVVLALGSKLKNGATDATPFDSVEDGDTYYGYSGLRDALRDMNIKYEKAGYTDSWARVQLHAILKNNSADVIVIRDDNAAPDNKPTSGGDNKPGAVAGVLTIENKDSITYISDIRDGDAIKKGDTFTITLSNTSYEVKNVTGAAIIASGNGYRVQATADTVKIEIVKKGGGGQEPSGEIVVKYPDASYPSAVEIWVNGAKLAATDIADAGVGMKSFTVSATDEVVIYDTRASGSSGAFDMSGKTANVYVDTGKTVSGKLDGDAKTVTFKTDKSITLAAPATIAAAVANDARFTVTYDVTIDGATAPNNKLTGVTTNSVGLDTDKKLKMTFTLPAGYTLKCTGGSGAFQAADMSVFATASNITSADLNSTAGALTKPITSTSYEYTWLSNGAMTGAVLTSDTALKVSFTVTKNAAANVPVEFVGATLDGATASDNTANLAPDKAGASVVKFKLAASEIPAYAVDTKITYTLSGTNKDKTYTVTTATAGVVLGNETGGPGTVFADGSEKVTVTIDKVEAATKVNGELKVADSVKDIISVGAATNAGVTITGGVGIGSTTATVADLVTPAQTGFTKASNVKSAIVEYEITGAEGKSDNDAGLTGVAELKADGTLELKQADGSTAATKAKFYAIGGQKVVLTITGVTKVVLDKSNAFGTFSQLDGKAVNSIAAAADIELVKDANGDWVNNADVTLTLTIASAPATGKKGVLTFSGATYTGTGDLETEAGDGTKTALTVTIDEGKLTVEKFDSKIVVNIVTK